jgi:hypothetical protein
MKFLCLAYEEEQKLTALSRSEWAELKNDTLVYLDELRVQGHIVGVEALKSSRYATTVRVRDGMASAVDGPFAETKEQLGGFFLIQARDQDEAIQIASKWPSARLGSIEVRPIEETLPEAGRYL